MSTRRLKVFAVVASALLITVVPSKSASATASDGFDSSAQTWKVYQDYPPPPLPVSGSGDPVYSSTGGNPGGYISMTDLVADNPPTGLLFFDSSNVGSSPWVGNHSDNNLGQFSFDLRATDATRGPLPYLFTYGQGYLSPRTDLPEPLPNTWKSYSLSLDAAQGHWDYCPPAEECRAATQNDILRVLTYHFRLIILADTNVGAGETVGLDNPTFSGGSPPPDTDADGTPDAIDDCPSKVGYYQSGCPAVRALSLSYNKGTFSGDLEAYDGYAPSPCASERTVSIYRKTRSGQKRVASITTSVDEPYVPDDQSGAFSVKKKRLKPGKYFAAVEYEVLTVGGDPHGCASAESSLVKVR